MLETISNNKLQIQISSLGAEIKSIQTVGDKFEYIWAGDEQSWKRSSPILFPIVGALNNDTYDFDGKQYFMPSHGFARDGIFKVIKKNENEVLFSLSDSKESLKIFPCRFTLNLGYALSGKTLTVSYSLENREEKEIRFSIGAHPGFNCPLDEGLSFSDYKLVFNKNENSQRRFKGEKVLTGRKELFLNQENEIQLDHSLFKDGALIFDDLKSDTISLESDKGKRKVKMDFSGFPYFGIWTWPKAAKDFLCLEPWFGIDSTEGDSSQWMQKEGLVSLGSGKTFSASYTIEIE